MSRFVLNDSREDNNRPAISTGDQVLDEVTSGGIRPGEVWVVGVSDDTIKHDWATQTARFMARAGQGVGLNLPDKSAEYIFTLIHSEISGVPVSHIRPGLSDEDYHRLQETLPNVAELTIYIDDTYSKSIVELKGKLRAMLADGKIHCCIVDYLAPLNRNLTAWVEDLAASTRAFKDLATSYSIGLISLVQPKLEGANESKSMLEQLARPCIENGATLVTILSEGDLLNAGNVH